ncbi:hypothetical protein ABID22_001756 [Pontibacter aydingkolensis]|uniref:Uncharacterized protein n=1 Tax=Pontibacter aydingkolensis TaxID=1911536 RepID=A0ABS7CQ69_9BACT|nr:hypothetical protein [Pontibacter aydingkolensis]MBW7465856.1 hypothetical protein [Pontibacter aydingkolensis]
MRDDFDYDEDFSTDYDDEDDDDLGMTFEEDVYLMIREKLRDTIQEFKGKYPDLKKLESAVGSFKVNAKNTDDSKFYPLAAKLLSEHIKPLTNDSEEIQEIYDNMQADIARFKNQRAHGHEGDYYLTS